LLPRFAATEGTAGNFGEGNDDACAWFRWRGVLLLGFMQKLPLVLEFDGVDDFDSRSAEGLSIPVDSEM
jgi:hypothetical protein